MFFGLKKKKQKELTQNLDTIKKETVLQIKKLKQWLESHMAEEGQKQSEEQKQNIEVLMNRIDELMKSQKRQAQSLEDFLDEDQERMAASKIMRQEIQRGKEMETALVALVCCYQEQLHLLQQQIIDEVNDDLDKRAAWKKQFELVKNCIKKQMRTCAMEETGEAGEPVDFEIHEVLSASEAEDSLLEGRVARVFAPGCIYSGNIVRKAKVAGYRRREDGDNHRN